MKEFLRYTKDVLVQDFRAQLAPIVAIRNFIIHFAYNRSTD